MLLPVYLVRLMIQLPEVDLLPLALRKAEHVDQLLDRLLFHKVTPRRPDHEGDAILLLGVFQGNLPFIVAMDAE